MGRNFIEEPKSNTGTSTNKHSYVFTTNEKQWCPGSRIPNVGKLENKSTFYLVWCVEANNGVTVHMPMMERKWSGWLIWTHQHCAPTTFSHHPFETPNASTTRGFVTSKSSALPHPGKINILEGSDYISGDFPFHKNVDSCNFFFLVFPFLLSFLSQD